MLSVRCEYEIVVKDDLFFFLMIRRPPRSTQSRSSAASDVYKRQDRDRAVRQVGRPGAALPASKPIRLPGGGQGPVYDLSLIHISEPTRLLSISYAVFCLKKKTLSPSHFSYTHPPSTHPLLHH